MLTNAIFLIILAMVEAIIIIQLIKIAKAKNILLDIPNNRSSHKSATPKIGGIGIFFLFVSSLFLYPQFLLDNYLTVIAIVLIFCMGLLDDLMDLPPYPKFIVMIISSILIINDGYTVNTLGTYFSTEATLGMLSIPFTIFAVVGFTNAINLIDGLDGLSGSISFVILLGFLYLGFIYDDSIIIYFSSVMILGISVFLYFNLNPAKIFLGDNGALLVGFIIALIGIKLLDYISPTSVFFLTGIPILDTLFVMVNRIKNKTSPFVADKTHLHHQIFRHTQDAKKTVFIMCVSQMMFTLIGLSLIDNADFLNLSIFATIYILFFIMLTSSKNQKEIFNKEKSI
ncbi:MAG: MraY family glycosyltransferase [Campylobacterota bacterium]|nr:MraY family glycosyltransferase [Campylobacterota bacterium]